MTDTTHEAPDWENFAKAVLTEWPTNDLEGSVLFDLSLQYGMIKEVPGGYNPDHHIDADGICPEKGDPWYEYTFRGEAGPGLYSITDMVPLSEAQAMVAAALTEAAAILKQQQDECEKQTQALGGMEERRDDWHRWLGGDLSLGLAKSSILALITTDAHSALDRMLAERTAERDALLEQLADMYRLHLRRGPAWDHEPTKKIMDRVRETLAIAAAIREGG